MKIQRVGFIALLILGGVPNGPQALLAQASSNQKPVSATEDVLFEAGTPVMLPFENKGQLFERAIPPDKFGGIAWIASEMSFDAAPVKGAPYSAEAVTESVQTLIDGNRIQHKNTATIFRDSEGRTRREQTLTAIGPWAATGEQTQTVFINDPISGVNYVLNARDKTARKLPAPGFISRSEAKGGATQEVRHDEVHQVRVGPPPLKGGEMGVAFAEFHQFNTEANQSEKQSLGKRLIEGVEAEGTRTTLTIPAGQVGNELPMQIVSERWFSPELKVLLLSKNSDPRMGDSTYRLTNISRSEQSPSLFEVPADYKIEEGPEHFLFKTRPDPASR